MPLVADYHAAGNDDTRRLVALSQLLERCYEYRQNSDGSRTDPVMQLGKGVLNVVAGCLKRHAPGATTDSLVRDGMRMS